MPAALYPNSSKNASSKCRDPRLLQEVGDWNIQRFSFQIEITAKVARKILILLLVFIVGIIG
ncbi:hypothetical protein [Sphaerospermopsis torques-reginae]|jgi:hypothetical protein|uniref:Uncharacterized protein n=1 Tax=Sphaerospermopsis torques-reginae ITEP-024 TaxID=984208 RepID=A0ABX8X719_9CYAN|nr:hypothetical protein [Sphaerospermopsis torques-reginae]QYX34379.1 hypothetical protein K2F26_20340 [Sphaerospermopsis torques-reginae ITEP-024]